MIDRRRRQEPRPSHFRYQKPPKKFVRWDDSGIHVKGTYSSEVRGKSWLVIRADVRVFLGRLGVYPADRFQIMKNLTPCTRQEHEALQHQALNAVCLPGRLAKLGWRGRGEPV